MRVSWQRFGCTTAYSKSYLHSVAFSSILKKNLGYKRIKFKEPDFQKSMPPKLMEVLSTISLENDILYFIHLLTQLSEKDTKTIDNSLIYLTLRGREDFKWFYSFLLDTSRGKKTHFSFNSTTKVQHDVATLNVI